LVKVHRVFCHCFRVSLFSCCGRQRSAFARGKMWVPTSSLCAQELDSQTQGESTENTHTILTSHAGSIELILRSVPVNACSRCGGECCFAPFSPSTTQHCMRHSKRPRAQETTASVSSHSNQNSARARVKVANTQTRQMDVLRASVSMTYSESDVYLIIF
jgi:hypothetical protein